MQTHFQKATFPRCNLCLQRFLVDHPKYTGLIKAGFISQANIVIFYDKIEVRNDGKLGREMARPTLPFYLAVAHKVRELTLLSPHFFSTWHQRTSKN